MPILRKPIEFETAFGVYNVNEILGEGGAGRVYGGSGPDGGQIALKVLLQEHLSSDKRRRFKNETAFLLQNKHSNIVSIVDHGVACGGQVVGPFYVMKRYDTNLRGVSDNQTLSVEQVLPLFSQILDGVEAAHLQNVVHRDLKPENILFSRATNSLAIADFGIARFTEDLLATKVLTSPAQRLANFQYAAPEQREQGSSVDVQADLYALGLILNELFTGSIPVGTGYKEISTVSTEWGFLDSIVARMLRQSPSERPASIAEVKELIQRNHREAVSLQKLSRFTSAVVKADEIDDPLANDPPKLVDAAWDGQRLVLTLDREVTQEWVDALGQMGSYASVWGMGPEKFGFQGKCAYVDADEHEVQPAIDNFKTWLPTATQTLKQLLKRNAQIQEAKRLEDLRLALEAEEKRLRVARMIRI